MESREGPQLRYTCISCRNPIGHKDIVSVKEKSNGCLNENYHCVSCAIEGLREISYEEAVRGQLVLKWIGKTWSFEMPLHERDVWNDFQGRLKGGSLFPEDSLIKREAEG